MIQEWKVSVCVNVCERERTVHCWGESMHVLQGCTILYEMCLYEEMYVHTYVHACKVRSIAIIFLNSLISRCTAEY